MVELAASSELSLPFFLRKCQFKGRLPAMMVASLWAFLQYIEKNHHDLAVEIQWVARLALPIEKS